MADLPTPKPVGSSSTVEIKRLPHVIEREKKAGQEKANDWSRARRLESVQVVKELMQSQIAAGQPPMAAKEAIELATSFKEFLRPNGRQEPENAPDDTTQAPSDTNG